MKNNPLQSSVTDAFVLLASELEDMIVDPMGQRRHVSSGLLRVDAFAVVGAGRSN